METILQVFRDSRLAGQFVAQYLSIHGVVIKNNVYRINVDFHGLIRLESGDGVKICQRKTTKPKDFRKISA